MDSEGAISVKAPHSIGRQPSPPEGMENRKGNGILGMMGITKSMGNQRMLRKMLNPTPMKRNTVVPNPHHQAVV